MGLFERVNMKKFWKKIKWILLIFMLFIAGIFAFKMLQDYRTQKLAEEEVIKVACVGDSLTFCRSFTDEVHVYPTYLSEMLGNEYYVVNYGVGGACVQSDLERAYTSTRVYEASIEKDADIIIIMLGSNDVLGNNWRDEETFYKYYVELVESYLESDDEPEIYLCKIPKIYAEEGDYWGTELQEKTEMVIQVIEKVAQEKNLHLIDMNTITSKHPEWYLADGLHFNYDGTIGVTEAIYEAIVDPIKVACVGDSITFRYGFEDEPENNYPYVLQALLGNEYWVKNFGESGTCIQENTDDAYIIHDKYEKSLEYQADVLLFMLGTNDSKVWNWKDEESFRQAYEKLLDSYMKMENLPKVYVIISPKAFYISEKDFGTAEFGIEPAYVDKIANIQLEVAEERGYSVVNMYEISNENPTWFEEDGIHPTKEGAEGMAQVIAEVILNEQEE